LLPVSSADGNILLMRPQIGGGAIRIEQGRDIEAFAARHDVSERFSEYLLKGQAAGDDEHNGRAVAHAKGEAKDPGVKRYRPLMIVAEDQGSNASLKERAEWEAKVRAAKAQGIDVTLSGWRRPDGGLWSRGATIDLLAPSAFITSQLIIANVNYQIADGGSTTVLSLAQLRDAIVALIAGVVGTGGGSVPTTRQVNGGGLITGGGALAADLVLSLAAATVPEVIAQIRNDVAVTPAGLAGLISLSIAGSSVTIQVGPAIIQIFRATVSGNSALNAVLPTTFPTACMGAWANGGKVGTNQQDNGPYVTGEGVSIISLFNAIDDPISATILAIGY
jgi:hypothetical protein